MVEVRSVTVLIDCLTSETRTAVLRDDEPVAFSIHPPLGVPRVGEVHAVRARNANKAGTFVDFASGLDGFIPAGFLSGLKVAEGDRVVVEVRREAVRGKGCRVAPFTSAAPSEPSLGLLKTLHGPASEAVEWLDDDAVAVIRIEGSDDAVSAARADIQAHRPALEERIKRYVGAQPIFQMAGVDADLWAMDSPEVPLSQGGKLTVEPTAALIAIDIDSGAASPGQANRAALEAIVQAMRLRGLAGVMMIDPAGSVDRHQGFRLAGNLAKSFEAASLDAEIKGVTRAGLVEVVRRKRREGIAETLNRLRTRVYAAFRAAYGAQAETPAETMVVVGNVDLIELMKRPIFDAERDAFRARHGRDLRLEVDKAMARGVFEVKGQSE